ncbi:MULTISPECIES: hypothetical protein [unclassified Nitratiruptor]|uniref:hypothetical protein n=1 Tax=unclassified Nitratiruptor TaxID=2624044 RepID=UPI0018EBB22E|nr:MULTISPECIES: hypothetical protein [unclassified Nitratiruptor]BCD61165.1 hypothetical protein NitYY0810_P29 [Nitratiruptor sp. YY08-10]BCD65098.1 hypothetical protein NitYY0814_P29 [Nitratiruptor sp. YY08-14]
MEMKVVNIRVNTKKWELFKKLAKYQNSDASKEIRKFMDQYLKKHNQLFLEMEAKEAKREK